MAHARKQIRDKIKLMLTGLTTTGNNVFFDYANTINPKNLPALLIFTGSENVSNIIIGQPRLQERLLNINIIGVVKASSNYQDTCDLIVKEVENVFGNNIRLDNLVLNTQLNQIETEYNDDLDEVVGSVNMSYTITYRVYENNIELIIN